MFASAGYHEVGKARSFTNIVKIPEDENKQTKTRASGTMIPWGDHLTTITQTWPLHDLER